MATYRRIGWKLSFVVAQFPYVVAEFFYHKCTHHVVFKAEDAVVDVKLCQLLFMDTDLVLLLDLHYPSLNLLPCCIGEL